MKKKIFLMALMVMTLICIFALSVSAADTNEFGTVEKIEGIDLTDMNKDGDAKVVLVESDGITYHTYPANYIVKDSATLAFDFTKIGNDQNGEAYDKDSIVRFELPKGVTTISGKWCIGSKTGLVEVILGNDLTTIEKEIFSNYSALSKVTFGNKLTEIGRHTFNGTAITELVIPDSVTSLSEGYNFQGCKSLVNVTLSKNLTTIPAYAFSSCHNLVITIPDNVETIGDSAFETACYYSGDITINQTSKLKSIGTKAFYDTQKAQGSIYLPSSLETIGSYAFANSGFSDFENLENTQVTKIESCTFYNVSAYSELRLPKNLTEIGSSAIFLARKVYVPKTLTTVASSSFYTTWKSGMVIFTGDSADLLKTCTKLADATVIDASEYNETATYSGFNIVINYNHCKAFYGDKHNINETSESLVYEKGYDQVGTYSYSCSRCEATFTEEKPALFKNQGFSTQENGGDSIVICYLVDKAAITAYEATGKTVEYGVFAVLKSNLLDESGNVALDALSANGVIKADLTDYGFDAFNLKITGFNTDEQKSAQIVLGAYVTTSDGETYYMQDDKNSTKGENDNYYYTSYNMMFNAATETN